MHAAVVHSFDRPPRYDAFPRPEPGGEHEVVVRVLASGLHPRVRSTANGSHYTSGDELPLIPGIDGVGRTPSGVLVYFVLPDTRLGAMAELTVVDRRRSVTLPDDSDPVAIAAGMNPAMSSWLALRKRIDFAPGKRVLVLGATGNAGRLAVQVAKRLGAGEVIAAGRDPERLAALGADSALTLTDDGALAAAADVDVVTDYLWGAPAERVMTALVTHRADRGRALDWIQIGSVAGPTAAIPSAALRAANLRVLGSGQGSIPTADIVGELPALAAEITSGALTVNPTAIPLSDVEAAWSAPVAPGTRVVFTP